MSGWKPGALSGNRRSTRVRPMHHPVQARVGRVDARTCQTPGRADDTVCKCDPGAHWTRFVRVHRARVRL
jgi:hypothetical protein